MACCIGLLTGFVRRHGVDTVRCKILAARRRKGV